MGLIGKKTWTYSQWIGWWGLTWPTTVSICEYQTLAVEHDSWCPYSIINGSETNRSHFFSINNQGELGNQVVSAYIWKTHLRRGYWIGISFLQPLVSLVKMLHFPFVLNPILQQITASICDGSLWYVELYQVGPVASSSWWWLTDFNSLFIYTIHLCLNSIRQNMQITSICGQGPTHIPA